MQGLTVLTRTILALCAILLLALPAHAALSEPYPTGGAPGIATVRLDYLRSVGSNSPVSVELGFFHLLTHGWIKATLQPSTTTLPRQTNVAARNVEYPIHIEYGSGFMTLLPKSVRDKIYIEVTLQSKPHWDQANTTPPQTQRLRIPVGLYEPSGLDRGPMVARPVGTMHWIDQDVVVHVEIWVEPNLLNTTWTPPNKRYVKDLFVRQTQNIAGRVQQVDVPITLRAIKFPSTLVSPYLVPVALIGRPPGNNSWSSLTQQSGGGAGLAIYSSDSTSVSVQESFGLGPIQFTGPTETVWRNQGAGVIQHFSFQSAMGRRTNNQLEPGAGDVMVGLIRPTFELYQAQLDMDFRLLPSSLVAPTFITFTMQELLTPTPGTPVSRLTTQEKGALRALDPLLGNPYAVLSSPRYALIRTEIVQPGTQVGGQVEMKSITKAEMQAGLGRSTTSTSTSSFTVPLGALGNAIGSPIPLPDLSSRTTETTTVSAEFRSTQSLERSTGNLVEFQIADSDPSKMLIAEIYYDTYFRTFAFRDGNTPPVQTAINTMATRYGLKDSPLRQIQSMALPSSVQGTGGSFVIATSLSDLAPQGGTAVITATGKAPTHISIPTDTGNIVLPNMEPGQYQVQVANRRATLTIDTQGRATLSGAAPTPVPFVPLTQTIPSLKLQPPAFMAITNQLSGKCLDVAGKSFADGGNIQQLSCHGEANQLWQLKSLGERSYQIVNKNSGKCVDIAGGSKNDGGNVHQLACHAGLSQRWTLTPLTGGFSQFTNQNSGKCLDVVGGSLADGANVQQFRCHGGASQKFRLQGAASSPTMIVPRGVESSEKSEAVQGEPQPQTGQ